VVGFLLMLFWFIRLIVCSCVFCLRETLN
jgi:hypothetical protein